MQSPSNCSGMLASVIHFTSRLKSLGLPVLRHSFRPRLDSGGPG